MKFFVCIKQVPDIDAPLHIKDGKLILDNDRSSMNAYDASAVEGALLLAEKVQGSVEVVLAGPETGRDTIRKALAMGADRGTHILVNEPGYDSYINAKILAAFFTGQEYDFIFCGKQSQDTDAGLTGSMLAEMLSLPYASNAVEIAFEEKALLVTRQGDHGQEMITLPSPGLVTCSNDMNNPRIPGLKGIMQSKKKPVEMIALHDLISHIPDKDVMTRTVRYEEKPLRKPGKKLTGKPDEIARELARALGRETPVL